MSTKPLPPTKFESVGNRKEEMAAINRQLAAMKATVEALSAAQAGALGAPGANEFPGDLAGDVSATIRTIMLMIQRLTATIAKLGEKVPAVVEIASAAEAIETAVAPVIVEVVAPTITKALSEERGDCCAAVAPAVAPAVTPRVPRKITPVASRAPKKIAAAPKDEVAAHDAAIAAMPVAPMYPPMPSGDEIRAAHASLDSVIAANLCEAPAAFVVANANELKCLKRFRSMIDSNTEKISKNFIEGLDKIGGKR